MEGLGGREEIGRREGLLGVGEAEAEDVGVAAEGIDGDLMVGIWWGVVGGSAAAGALGRGRRRGRWAVGLGE